jgi:hypothetical protein
MALKAPVNYPDCVDVGALNELRKRANSSYELISMLILIFIKAAKDDLRVSFFVSGGKDLLGAGIPRLLFHRAQTFSGEPLT